MEIPYSLFSTKNVKGSIGAVDAFVSPILHSSILASKSNFNYLTKSGIIVNVTLNRPVNISKNYQNVKRSLILWIKRKSKITY